MNYFYQNRAGVDISADYITSQGKNASKSKLECKAGHNPDQAFIQTKWVRNYADDGSDVEADLTIDCTGGWYEGNDYSKYVPNGAISVWMLQNMYERALSGENNSDVKKFADNSGTVVIPEAGNKYPDLLDEARVELEWMFKMLVPSDYEMSVYDANDIYAPFAWVMSFMEDEAPNVKVTIVDPVDYGDMNCDGKVSITDLVMMARYAAEDPEMNPPTAQGIKNADCYCDGKVNSSDITTLARFLAHLIPEAKILPE